MTLAEVRQELHQLAQLQATLRLRVRRGELVPRHRPMSVSVTVGHRQRDAILVGPTRYGAILAAEHGVDGRALMYQLRRVLEAECRAIAADARARSAAKDAPD